MAITYNTRVVRDGLVLHLDAANIKSYPGTGTTWTDLSGNSNNGTLVDGPSFSQKVFSFDGLNDRVHILSPQNKFDWTPSGSGLNTLSIEMWFKTSETSGNLISKPWNGSGEYNYRFAPNVLYFQIGAQSYSTSFTSLATGEWINGVFIITPTQVSIYKNGNIHLAPVNHNITNNIPSIGGNNIDLCIMSLYPYGTGWAGNTGFSIQGDVGLLKIYNRTLTATEIRQNFEAHRDRYGV